MQQSRQAPGATGDAMIADNLLRVNARIASACALAGRPVQSVTLLVVSKTFPAEAVREAFDAGGRRFGENYVQEGLDKIERLADLRGRIVQNKMDFQAFYLTLSRVAAESRISEGPSAATSIIKYAAATLAQQRAELMVEAMGTQGLGWDGDDFHTAERMATRGWLRSKGNSIEGGTSEVNVNVVAKRVLGLPDPVKH